MARRFLLAVVPFLSACSATPGGSNAGTGTTTSAAGSGTTTSGGLGSSTTGAGGGSGSTSGGGSSTGGSSSGTTGGGTGDGGPRPWPDTSAAIAVFSDQIDVSAATEAQLQFAAAHYAGAQKLLRSEVRHLRQYNPGFLLLHYRLAQALGHSVPDSNCDPTTQYLEIIDGDQWVQEWPGDANVQESWFFHFGGQRVFSCQNGHYLMALDDPGWRSFWPAQIVAQIQACEADGIFADSFSIPNYFGGSSFKPNLPDIDASFESSWATLEHDWTDRVRQELAGRYRWIPNVGAWITGRDPSDYSNVDGAMIEGFVDWGGGQYFAESDWQLELDRVLGLVAADKIVLAQTYPNGADVGERLFILGSYLLIRGAHTYLNLDAYGQQIQWFPEYGIDLGAANGPVPTDIESTRDPTSQLYVRSFAKGQVWVNPKATPQTATLGTTYYQVVPSGGGPVDSSGTPAGSLSTTPITSLSLPAHRAAVLLLSPL